MIRLVDRFKTLGAVGAHHDFPIDHGAHVAWGEFGKSYPCKLGRSCERPASLLPLLRPASLALHCHP
jgi:hypothetical protein